MIKCNKLSHTFKTFEEAAFNEEHKERVMTET